MPYPLRSAISPRSASLNVERLFTNNDRSSKSKKGHFLCVQRIFSLDDAWNWHSQLREAADVQPLSSLKSKTGLREPNCRTFHSENARLWHSGLGNTADAQTHSAKQLTAGCRAQHSALDGGHRALQTSITQTPNN